MLFTGGIGKERVDALEQNVAPEGLKPERHVHRRASVSLEVEFQVSVGPLVSHLVVGLSSRRACKVQGMHLQPRTHRPLIWRQERGSLEFGPGQILGSMLGVYPQTRDDWNNFLEINYVHSG